MEFYFIKTTGDLIKTQDKEPGCEIWIKTQQRWREESLSFSHDMIEHDCVMELQKPFRGLDDML